MRESSVWRLGLGLVLAGLLSLAAQESSPASLLQQARGQQTAGDWAKAKATLSQAVQQFPQDVEVAKSYARLLDASADPQRAAAYERLAALQKEHGQDDRAARRRLAVLQLAAGNRTAAGATGVLSLPALTPPSAPATIHFPGPLSSFRRMAAISSQTRPEDLMAALSRNVFTLGFHYSQRLNKTSPTEYLTLLTRYVELARDLEKMAGPDGVLHVASCKEAGPVLKVLGFRPRKGNCGTDAVLETEDPNQAFLTIDSGFPLAELEAAFRSGKAFHHPVKGADIPILFTADAWFDKARDPLDQLLESKEIARLYYAMSRLDWQTADTLRQSPGLTKMQEVAPALDFYGNSIIVDKGRVVLPGGPERQGMWVKMVGADPGKPGDFLFAFLDKDNGWLAAYADAFHQLDARQQAYFYSGDRLERFYKALRGDNVNPGSARPVFRPNAELLLLPARLRLDAEGRPLAPGGVATWKTLLLQQTPKGAKGGSRGAPKMNDADDLVENMFARIRLFEENGLLNIFVALNEMDRLRGSHPLEPATVLALAHEYSRFSHHYALMADWPEINDASILKFLKVADNLVKGKTQPLVKANSLGTFQALVGLWEILARQGQIPENALNSSFDALLNRFAGNMEKPTAVFDAGRQGLEGLVSAAGATLGSPRMRGAGIQETVFGLLAGPPPVAPGDAKAREYVIGQLRGVFDAQRLIRLDTVLGLADALDKPGSVDNDLVLRLAGQLREFRLPTPYVTSLERNAAFPGYWTERHLEQMRDLDIGSMVEKRQRGMLAPFLRDTLVGLNYAYYAPPGAQVLYHNPLFVRSHDFMGRNGTGTGNEVWGPSKVSGTGWPLSGGGRLVGSLSGLPYGLAEAEQDFLVPQYTQALIWSDLAPQMLVSAVVPRFWRATARQQRWVALNQRFAEDIVSEAVVEGGATRTRLLDSLQGRIDPQRHERVRKAIEEARLQDALALLTPADLYHLSRKWTAEIRQMAASGPVSAAFDSPAFAEMAMLAGAAPQELTDAKISSLFGVPRPKLARSWRPELLGLAPLPALQGYSSRLLAESWESNNLYWARLADEMEMPPASLHWLVPQLTRRLIEHIFANHHEDWPAVLRAMRLTADEFRKQAGASATRVTE